MNLRAADSCAKMFQNVYLKETARRAQQKHAKSTMVKSSYIALFPLLSRFYLTPPNNHCFAECSKAPGLALDMGSPANATGATVNRKGASEITWYTETYWDAVGKWRLKFIPFSFGFHNHSYLSDMCPPSAASILQSSGCKCYQLLSLSSQTIHFALSLLILEQIIFQIISNGPFKHHQPLGVF